MRNRIFENWLSTFRDSIITYEYYTDFTKVYKNAEKLKMPICLLNSLIGSKNIEQEFEKLLIEYPKCLQAIPILLAVRKKEIFCRDDDNSECTYLFKKPNQSIEQYKYFMRRTGLFDLLENHIVNNLYDYVTGVETGLDSNSRKNRVGEQMENLVKKFLIEANVEYFEQKYDREVEEMFGLDLSAISAQRTSNKRFDFVVKGTNKIFAIETNFYTGGGSKLNETARSYKMLAEESRGIDSFVFVWITDGKGWKKTWRNLKETFLILPTLYNIRDMENGIFLELFNG